MAVRQRVARDWAADLRARVGRPPTPAEIERRVAESRRALARRDARPSIAPVTTGTYVREIREEAAAEA